MLTDTGRSPYAKIQSLDWDKVTWTGGLWKNVEDMLYESMVPNLKMMFDSKDISHVIENFRICAGDASGDFDGTVFGDGDFYKWMESAVYMAEKRGDKELLAQLDEYIALFGRAQQEDGYLSTKQIIGEKQNNGVKRMGDIDDFEVYNFGHMFTSACIYKRLTGKDDFMKIAAHTADYLEQMYEEAAKNDEVQTAVCPSHYMGLIEFYRTTKDERYLNLARQAVALRDSVKNGTDDNQDRIPLKTHRKIVGHAVRSNYLYAGVADLYAEIGDEEYKEVLDCVWKDLMESKIYITGGCGALYNGVSPYGNFFKHSIIHQAYGYEYQLPNITAYAETCANIGLTMWAYRMFNIEPKAEYMDILEKTMLNVNLEAVSLDGKRYFYENMLRRTKDMKFELIWPLERTSYILSYCCPPNLARVLAQSSEYAYGLSKDSVWMGMYGENRAQIQLENGAKFALTQTTQYPYDGKICLEAGNVEKNGDSPVKFQIRVPFWVKSGKIKVIDKKKDSMQQEIILTGKQASSYVEVQVDFLENARVEIDFDMPVTYVQANNMVEETTGQIAVTRGPLVYCVESMDFDGETLDDLYMKSEPDMKAVSCELEGTAFAALEGTAYKIVRTDYDRDCLYQEYHAPEFEQTKIRMIPYFAWDNRGKGEMRIWIPVRTGK